MFRRPKLLITGLIVVAFGFAMLLANGSDRAGELAHELVEASTVVPENEGKLVIVSGTPELADGGVIVDEEAALQVSNAVHYSRVPYQKVYAKKKREVVVDKGEDKISETDDKKRTEYYVAGEWINADQSRDEVVSGNSTSYENPSPLNLSAYHASGKLSVSGFRISSSDVFGYIETKNGWFTAEELEQACGHYITRSEIDLRPVTDEYGRGMLSSGDEIGDVHVHFSYETLEHAEIVTLIGRQQGDRLVLEENDLVRESELAQPGIVSKEEFLDSVTSGASSGMFYGIGTVVVGIALVIFSLDLRPEPTPAQGRGRPGGR